MGKAMKETEESRENLLRRMSAGTNDFVEKVIPFQNNDVPNYLQNLAHFEEESRKTRIVIR